MNKRISYSIIKVLLLTCSLIYTFVFVIMGFGNHMDPFYWMELCQNPDSSSFMTMGTILVGKLWITISGDSVVSMRFLSWVITTTAIGLPYLCLLNKQQRKDNLHWLALAYFLTGYGVFQEYSAGSMSVLLMSITVVIWVKYLINHKYIYLLPFIIAFAIFVRFPNIIVILPLTIILILNGILEKTTWRVFFKDESIIIAGTTIVLMLLYYTTISDFSINTIFLGFSQQAEGGHSLSIMVEKLIKYGLVLIIDSLFIMVFGIILFYSNKINNNLLKWILSVFYSIIILLLAKRCFSWNDWYNHSLHYFISSIVLTIAIYVSGKMILQKQWKELLIVLSSVFICGVVPLGSDTAWLKLFPIILCLLPVLISKYLVEENKEIAYPTIIMFCLFTMTTYCFNPIGGKSLFQGRVFGTTKLYKHIFLPEHCNDYLNKLQWDFDQYGENGNTIAVGDGTHLFEELTKCKRYSYNNFWRDLNDEKFISFIRKEIESSHPVVFCMHTPPFIYKDYDIGQSLMEEMLTESGYNQVIDRSEDCYMIYVYNK